MEPAPRESHRRHREPWQRVVQGETLEFQRAFHRPTNLDANQRVYVAIQQPTVAAMVTLGQQLLGELRPGCDAVFDVTDRLEERNHLAVVVSGTTDDALPFAEVAIEIRAVSK